MLQHAMVAEGETPNTGPLHFVVIGAQCTNPEIVHATLHKNGANVPVWSPRYLLKALCNNVL